MGASDLLAQGDAAWARRAEGHDGEGRAAPGPIVDAIRAYEAAVAAAPEALEPRWKLLRALHFAADFASSDGDQEQAILDRATAAADGARPLLERSGANTRDAAALYFWSAVSWVAWAQRDGLIGAVRKGVAGRVRDDALAALELDSTVEKGGAHRMLAGLHATLPRVPFLSGWVARDLAIPEMQCALAIAPDHLGNRVLWALTLLDVAPMRRAEALAVLEAASAAEPSGEAIVEDLAIRKTARERLAEERARGMTAPPAKPGRIQVSRSKRLDGAATPAPYAPPGARSRRSTRCTSAPAPDAPRSCPVRSRSAMPWIKGRGPRTQPGRAW